MLVATPPNKALQLTWHSAFQSILIAFWHQPWVPQRPSAACATQLSAQSVGRHRKIFLFVQLRPEADVDVGFQQLKNRWMVSEYDSRGYIVLCGAIEASACKTMRDASWSELSAKHGVVRDSPETWTIEEPRGLSGLRRSGAFDKAVSPAITDAINTLIGSDTWDKPEHWWGPLVTFPSAGPWRLPHKRWHIDYPARGNLGLRFGVKLLGLLADMESQGGATLLATGTHHLVRELTLESPNGNAGSSSVVRQTLIQRGLDFASDVFEFTGKAGDVLIFDPWLFHNASRNVHTTPRLMIEQNIPTRKALSLFAPS